jgi:hypothetical protein
MSLFYNATMNKMSAMAFYKTIPGVIIDGYLTEEEKKTALEDDEAVVEEPVVEEPAVEEPVVEEPVVEEPVVEELKWNPKKNKKWSPFFIKPEVKTVVEEEAVVEYDDVAMALEEFKKEKTQALRRFTKASNIAEKDGTDGGIVMAVTDLQKSITVITDKFLRDIEKKGEASTSALEVSISQVSIQDEAPKTIKKKIVKKKLDGAM